ncbi:MAG: helix-turn-helix domain-containing protein [bacterium]|nr:helix-turn-helix domain-containing protein [bacterium]
MKTKKAKPVLKQRQWKILKALGELGGVSTTRAIAKSVGLHGSGVSQSLSALDTKKYVKYLGGDAGDARWQLEVCVSEL